MLIVGFGRDASSLDGDDTGAVEASLRHYLPDLELTASTWHNWAADPYAGGHLGRLAPGMGDRRPARAAALRGAVAVRGFGDRAALARVHGGRDRERDADPRDDCWKTLRAGGRSTLVETATAKSASRRQLGSLYEPRSIAIVGASADPMKWGHLMARDALLGAGRRRVYLVNAKGGEILGQTAYRSATRAA